MNEWNRLYILSIEINYFSLTTTAADFIYAQLQFAFIRSGASSCGIHYDGSQIGNNFGDHLFLGGRRC